MNKIFRFIKKHGVRKLLFEIFIRLIQFFRVNFYRYCFSNNSVSGVGFKINSATQFVGSGSILIDHASIGVWPSPGFINGVNYLEARSKDAVLEIGRSTFINNNITIIVDRTRVLIGERCLLGNNVFISDSDFHGLEIADRNNGNYKCLPVTIEDDVFVGGDVKILKGVRIGAGAIIANGSIVTRNVEPYTVVAGIPARVVKVLKKHGKS